MRAFFALYLALIPFVGIAGQDCAGRGAKPIALGNAFVAAQNSPWSIYYNPAALSVIDNARAAVFFLPQQFGLKEFRTISATASVPLNMVTMGLACEQFGFELYRERSARIGIGTSPAEGLGIGLSVNVFHISLERYGSTTVETLDAGLLVDVVQGLRMGFCRSNVGGTRIGSLGEQLPQLQSVGLQYAIGIDSQLAIELEKDLRFPFSFKAGYAQQFLNALELRFGVTTRPVTFSCGFGLMMGGFELSYAGLSHQQLGWTHALEIAIIVSE